MLTEQLQGIKSVQAFELDKLKRRCAAAEEAAAEGKAELRRRTTAVRNHEITAQRLAQANALLEHEVAELRQFKAQSVAAATAAAAAAAAEESKEKALRDDDVADKVAELGMLKGGCFFVVFCFLFFFFGSQFFLGGRRTPQDGTT